MGTLLSPGPTFRRLAESPRGRGASPIWILGAAWSLLSLCLAVQGRQPSGPAGPPFPAESYYFWQTLFLPPLLYGLWRFLTWTTASLARSLGGEGDPDALGNVLGYAYAVPVLVSLVLPDLWILLFWGFERLSRAMMYYAPVTLIWTLVLCTLGVRTVFGLSWVRAVTAALGGLMAQAMLGAVWIR